MIISYFYNNSIENQKKALTDNQIKAINIIKKAYENSKRDGFDIIHTSVCREISNIFGPYSINCSKNPIAVNVVNSNKITFSTINGCFVLETSLDGKSKLTTDRFIASNNCSGYLVGIMEWDNNNEMFNTIGYNKIRKMAIYSYLNNTTLDSFFFCSSFLFSFCDVLFPLFDELLELLKKEAIQI